MLQEPFIHIDFMLDVQTALGTATSIQIYFGGDRGAQGDGERESPSPLGEAQPPPENFFFDFESQNGDLWCNFCTLAKTLMG